MHILNLKVSTQATSSVSQIREHARMNLRKSA